MPKIEAAAILLAYDDAIKSEHQYKHGCAIFDKNKIIVTGRNKKKFVPSLKKYGYKKCLLHAESDAILKLEREQPMNKVTLLVLRVSKAKTKLCNSKPCEHCMAMIRERGIRKIMYSLPSGSFETIRC